MTPQDGFEAYPAAAGDKVPALSRRCRPVLANLSYHLERLIRAVLALRQLGGRQLWVLVLYAHAVLCAAGRTGAAATAHPQVEVRCSPLRRHTANWQTETFLQQVPDPNSLPAQVQVGAHGPVRGTSGGQHSAHTAQRRAGS